MVIEEDAGHEIAARAGTGLLEDRLQVVLHGVGGQVQGAGDLAGRASLGHQLRDPTLARGERVRIGDQGSELGRPRGLEQHRDGRLVTGAEQRPAHHDPTTGAGADPGASDAVQPIAVVATRRPANLPGPAGDGMHDGRQLAGTVTRSELVEPALGGFVGHDHRAVGTEHEDARLVVALRGVADHRGSAQALGERPGQRRHEPHVRRREVRAGRLAQQGQRPVRAQGIREDGPELVAETARAAELALTQAPVELAAGGIAQARGRPPRLVEGGELVDVGLADLDLGEPGDQRRRQPVVDDLMGGQERGGVDGQETGALERDGPSEGMGDRVGEFGHREAPVDEPDDVPTHPGAGGVRTSHRVSVPTTRTAQAPGNLGWR